MEQLRVHTTLRLLFWIVLYFCPASLLILGAIPFSFRFYVLIAVTLIAATVALPRHGVITLGLRTDNLKRSIRVNGAMSVAFLSILAAAPLMGMSNRHWVPASIGFYVFYVFVSSPCQEFLYRAVIAAELDSLGLKNRVLRLAAFAVPYAFMHLIYKDPITIILTLLIGIVWGIIYDSCRNLWGVSLSHATLGVVTILLGII